MAPLDLLITNLGIGLEPFILLFTGLIMVIFGSADFRLGVLLFMFSVGLEIPILQFFDLDIQLHAVALFGSFVLNILLLWVSYSRSKSVII